MSDKYKLVVASEWAESPWYLDFATCDEDGALPEAEFTGYILDANGTEVCNNAFPIATAHLIAAAPDLYAALKAIIDDLPISRDWLDPVNERWAKDALKQARGES